MHTFRSAFESSQHPFFEACKETLTYVEKQYAEHAEPKVKETVAYLEEHAQPKVQETWAYLEEQMSGQCWGSPGATPTEEEEFIIIDTINAKKMDLPVVDADPVEEISSVEDRNEAQPAADLQVMQQEIRIWIDRTDKWRNQCE